MQQLLQKSVLSLIFFMVFFSYIDLIMLGIFLSPEYV
ncbi:unnamed protein product, partial [marine sediment metagenome]